MMHRMPSENGVEPCHVFSKIEHIQDAMDGPFDDLLIITPRETSMSIRFALTDVPWASLSELWLHDVELQAPERATYQRAVMSALAAQVKRWTPRDNIEPTQDVLALRSGRGMGELGDPRDNYQMCTMRWGLIPSWAQRRNIGQRLLTARAESLLDRPAFRRTLRTQRCVLVVSGFYVQAIHSKGPYLVEHRQQPVMMLAGLWDRWVSPQRDIIDSCALVCSPTHEPLLSRHVHVPSVLSAAQAKQWLNPASSLDELMALVQGPVSTSCLTTRQVQPLVSQPESKILLTSEHVRPPHQDVLDAERAALKSCATQAMFPFLKTGS